VRPLIKGDFWSAAPPITDIPVAPGQNSAINGCKQPQQRSELFDHLVGKSKQRGRDREAKYLSGATLRRYWRWQATSQ